MNFSEMFKREQGSLRNRGEIAALKLFSATCFELEFCCRRRSSSAEHVFNLSRHGREPADYRVFQGEPTELRSIPGVIRSALSGQGRGLIQLGLLLLIATPIARVSFSVLGFAIERDRLYVLFTLIVLGILLLYSFAGSGVGL